MSMTGGREGKGEEMMIDKTFTNNDLVRLFPDARKKNFMYLQLNIFVTIIKNSLG